MTNKPKKKVPKSGQVHQAGATSGFISKRRLRFAALLVVPVGLIALMVYHFYYVPYTIRKGFAAAEKVALEAYGELGTGNAARQNHYCEGHSEVYGTSVSCSAVVSFEASGLSRDRIIQQYNDTFSRKGYEVRPPEQWASFRLGDVHCGLYPPDSSYRSSAWPKDAYIFICSKSVSVSIY